MMINSFIDFLSYLKLTDINLENDGHLLAKNKKIPKGFLIKNLNLGIIITTRIDKNYVGTIYQFNYPFSKQELEGALNDMVRD